MILRPALVGLLASLLAAAVLGGLLRAGVGEAALGDGLAVGRAAVAHAALMIGGFLGSVIALERAVALQRRSAFVAPAVSAVAGVLVLAGQPVPAGWLWVFAALVFVGASIAVLLRQAAAHTVLLLVGAVAWLVGNLLFALGLDGARVLPWWFTFLVVTIAAERLEMTRLMRRDPRAQPALQAIVAAMVAACGLVAADPVAGGVLYGAALLALAAWLGLFDIARRTALTHGLSRYMAVCLLGGYAWLGLAGAAWIAAALGLPGRDLALHGLGLGFVFSMVMAHAPVILPAVARVKLRFGRWFYVPLALLHGSLVLRLLGGLADPAMGRLGATLNAVSLAAFVATVAGAALAWRVHESRQSRPDPRR